MRGDWCSMWCLPSGKGTRKNARVVVHVRAYKTLLAVDTKRARLQRRIVLNLSTIDDRIGRDNSNSVENRDREVSSSKAWTK